ncbi:MAG: MBL fold metallo-hydrolase [Acidobacteria bacterium]|nr:MBL fold metallo-hydrolase [Acidobacteriota bacterium]
MRLKTMALLIGAGLAYAYVPKLWMSHDAEPAAGSKSNSNAKSGMQVVLLGTGFPRPDPERAGPSTAVIVGEKVFIVDAGRGGVQRLAATQLQWKNVGHIFLTHLHSDHIEGLPDLFHTSWMFGRAVPLELYGPPGTQEMSDAMVKFFAEDIHIRRDLTEMQPAAGATVNVHIAKDGDVVYQDADLRITSFAVDHRPVEFAFGYKFECGGKSVVISGDTRPNENVIKFAKGADILVHEVYLAAHFDRLDSKEVAARLKSYHTSAEEVGQVATKAGVKTLVLTHLIPADGGEKFVSEARKNFKGKIIVGKDLLRIEP